MSWRFHILFASAATLVVVSTIAWGFFLVGSPASRRLERLDEQRLDDLQTIAREVQAMVQDPNNSGKLREALPKTLEEAARRARNEKINLSDPESGEAYRYRATSETTYELCATFTGQRDSDASVFWNHPAGEHCFKIDVLDPPPFY